MQVLLDCNPNYVRSEVESGLKAGYDACAKGGTSIEDLAEKYPDMIIKVCVSSFFQFVHFSRPGSFCFTLTK